MALKNGTSKNDQKLNLNYPDRPHREPIHLVPDYPGLPSQSYYATWNYRSWNQH